ncbi:MAG: conjugal transfer transcriptional regulator TraJ [Pseudomonadota bacterium]
MENTTRKNTTPIKVYCLPDERIQLQTLAAASNKSVSTYLLTVGLGYRVQGILDNRRVEELVRINGDLGRLGGLLKLWLTDDVRTENFGEATIRALLSKIEDTQGTMHDVIRGVVIPKTER